MNDEGKNQIVLKGNSSDREIERERERWIDDEGKNRTALKGNSGDKKKENEGKERRNSLKCRMKKKQKKKKKARKLEWRK